MIPISEIFGPTLQGEGPLMGMSTVFVRVRGCDNKCLWCDTQYAREVAGEQFGAEMIVRKVQECCADPILVTLTGGNPAMYPELGDAVSLLKRLGYKVACETQGTYVQLWFTYLDHLVISPKPPSSGNPTSIEDFVLCYGSYVEGKIHVKVVVDGEADFAYAEEVSKQVGAAPVYLQPCTATGGLPTRRGYVMRQLDHIEKIWDMVKASGNLNYIVLPQLHRLLWGEERGV